MVRIVIKRNVSIWFILSLKRSINTTWVRIPISILFEIDSTLFWKHCQDYFENNLNRSTKKTVFTIFFVILIIKHHKQINHLKNMAIDDNPIARLALRSDSFWNSVSVLLNSLNPELSEIPLERLSTARTWIALRNSARSSPLSFFPTSISFLNVTSKFLSSSVVSGFRIRL